MAQDTRNPRGRYPSTTSCESFRSLLPTEFQDALTNNFPPRPAVLQAARALRDNPAPSVIASKKRIEEIDMQVKTLLEERERLVHEDSVRLAVVEACSIICAPARRLHADILHEIFEHALPDYPSPCNTDAPMTLSHVSSAWRSVALQSPRLWSKIHLRIKRLDRHRNAVRYAQGVNTWARRAGWLPVGLYLYVDCNLIPVGSDSADSFSALLKTIGPWSSRISCLGIGGHYWLNVMMQFADIQWDLRNLETLELLGQRGCERHHVDDDMATLLTLAPRISLFQACGPKLTTLIARQDMSGYLSAFSFLPWNTFRFIVLQEQLSTVDDLQQLLVRCPDTKVAALVLGEERCVDTPIDQVDCKLGQLHLEIKSWIMDELPAFFSAFKFTDLTHLHIDCEPYASLPHEDYDDAEIIPFLPSLSFLSLACLFSSLYIIKFLQNTPHLQVLNLEPLGSATKLNELPTSMTVVGNRRNFLPLLQELSIFIGASILLDVPILSNFIYSRTRDRPPSHSGLERFKITGAFAILTELPVDMFCVLESDETPPSMELNMNSSSGRSDSIKNIELPESSLAHERYEVLVDHSKWID